MLTGPQRRPARRTAASKPSAPRAMTVTNGGACPPPSTCAAHDKMRAAAVRAPARARRHPPTVGRCMFASIRLRTGPARSIRGAGSSTVTETPGVLRTVRDVCLYGSPGPGPARDLAGAVTRQDYASQHQPRDRQHQHHRDHCEHDHGRRTRSSGTGCPMPGAGSRLRVRCLQSCRRLLSDAVELARSHPGNRLHATSGRTTTDTWTRSRAWTSNIGTGGDRPFDSRQHQQHPPLPARPGSVWQDVDAARCVATGTVL